MTSRKFRDGDIVELEPFMELPKQYGEVLGWTNGVYMVCVFEQYRQPYDADGLVEVPEEQLTLFSKES